MLDPLAYRSQFDSLNGLCHLISNSLGAMPNRARGYALEYVSTWQQRGVRAWADQWWDLPRQVGNQVGLLMNAEPDTVSMHLNVTSAQATVQSCFAFTAQRNRIVMLDMEFPSVLYIYREWIREHGELVIVDSEDGITIDTDRVLAAIDERTLLVPISHVLFRSSFIIDAKRIIARAHEVGAAVVLDVFQSLGTVPVDVKDLDVDFVVGGCLKWLCGGPGACFLYVRPDLQSKLNPRLTGWMAHEHPFDFATDDIRFTTGSYKFMNGTANIPGLYTCRAGLDFVAEVGIDKIREHSTRLTDRLISLAAEQSWTINAPSDQSRRAGTVAVDMLHASEIAAELNARNILVDYRPKAGIRLSPHFYNTEDEITYAVAQILEIQKDNSWTRHEKIRRIVT